MIKCVHYAMCVVLAAFALAMVSSSDVVAQQADNNTDDQSIDEALLDDLGDEFLEGLDDIPLGSGGGETDSGGNDQKLLDELNEGEDVGQGPENELERIARQMKQAQRRIEQQEVSDQTQEIQKDVIAQLDALIQQLQQQKKKASPSAAQSKPSGGQKIKQPGQPDAGQQQPSDQPATDSTERLGQQDPQSTDAEALEALVKQVWGHLPDRARQEMQNAAVEEFLPKYQQVIEDYYRRLAEETP